MPNSAAAPRFHSPLANAKPNRQDKLIGGAPRLAALAPSDSTEKTQSQRAVHSGITPVSRVGTGKTMCCSSVRVWNKFPSNIFLVSQPAFCYESVRLPKICNTGLISLETQIKESTLSCWCFYITAPRPEVLFQQWEEGGGALVGLGVLHQLQKCHWFKLSESVLTHWKLIVLT